MLERCDTVNAGDAIFEIGNSLKDLKPKANTLVPLLFPSSLLIVGSLLILNWPRANI